MFAQTLVLSYNIWYNKIKNIYILHLATNECKELPLKRQRDKTQLSIYIFVAIISQYENYFKAILGIGFFNLVWFIK